MKKIKIKTEVIPVEPVKNKEQQLDSIENDVKTVLIKISNLKLKFKHEIKS